MLHRVCTFGCTTLNAFRLHGFHSNQALFAKQDMAPIASILHSVRAIAEIVRTGDIGAVAFSVSSVLNKQVVVEMRTRARTVSHTRKRATGPRLVPGWREVEF
jgi:hypothetical protein